MSLPSVERWSAFSITGRGGNPAGVLIADALPDAARMQAIAAEVGYSETAFAAPIDGGYRVRYFAPQSEVPFCGHATIALGAALARRVGPGDFALQLNDARISVRGERLGEGFGATLRSPPTRSAAADAALVDESLALFGLQPGQLDPRLPPARMHGGADHLLLALRERRDLAAMHYDLAAGAALMRRHGLVTIALVVALGDQHFAARNAFASGGVLEDPATGAAAAAFGGLLRDRGWPHGGALRIDQGEDMGQPSRIEVLIGAVAGEPVTVRGAAHPL
jgi:PhzF family phenazine biosynthesis protein